MPLESGHRVTIWSIEDKGTYAKANITGAKKNKEGKYEKDWSNGFCTLFGRAYENLKDVVIDKDNKEHITAQVGWGYEEEATTPNGKTYTRKVAPFSVSNNYDKAKGKQYTNYIFNDLTLVKSKSADDNDATEDTDEVENKVKEKETASSDMLTGTVGLDFLNVPDGISATLPFK